MFFGKILVAVDDSIPSQYAIDAGLTLALMDAASIVFAVAFDPSLIERQHLTLREIGDAIMTGITGPALERAHDLGIEASSQVLYEHPARGIFTIARSEKVGLIVMGTHGRTGIMRAMLRSIAEDVLRHTTTPLCVVRRPPRAKVYHRVLVAVADDDLSAMTIDYALEYARAFKATLLFCTVTTAGAASGVDAFLQQAKQRAAAAHVSSESVVVPRDGEVAAQILEQVHAEECDAILMASHARDGLKRLVQGSVAETVIRSSDTPVFVLRDPHLQGS
jgi:nucleotide-binding universal stress UspA family protein